MNRIGQAFPASIDLTFDPNAIARFVLCLGVGIELGFLIADYLFALVSFNGIEEMQRIFDITSQTNLASWFANTQILFTSMTVFVLFFCARKQTGYSLESTSWLIIALFLLFLTIDNALLIHQSISLSIWQSQEGSDSMIDGFPSHPWLIVFFPFYAAITLYIFYFLWTTLGDRLSRRLLGLSFICLGLALGMGFIEGLEPEHEMNLYTWIGDNTEMDYWSLEQFDDNAFGMLHHFSQALAKILGMFSNTLLWFLAIRHIAKIVSSIKIHLPGA